MTQMWDGANKKDLRLAAEALRRGELVAFPTETVYGLGANGLDPLAVASIYAAKGRPSDNPLILHIYDKSQLDALSDGHHADVQKVIEAFWPGPLTLVLPKSKAVPKCVTGGLDTVAIRMPSNKIANALLRLSRIPLAAPSANLSGKPSPTTAEHVRHDMDGKIAGIVDGGSCEVGLESTVLDLSGVIPVILRPGAVTKEMLEEVLQKEVLVSGHGVNADEIPRAPGMKYRHYAPNAAIKIVPGDGGHLITRIAEEIAAAEKPVGVMLSEETLQQLDLSPDILQRSLGSRANASEAAARLFEIMRWFDQTQTKTIITEEFAQDHIGAAVMNRLKKAAGTGE